MIIHFHSTLQPCVLHNWFSIFNDRPQWLRIIKVLQNSKSVTSPTKLEKSGRGLITLITIESMVTTMFLFSSHCDNWPTSRHIRYGWIIGKTNIIDNRFHDRFHCDSGFLMVVSTICQDVGPFVSYRQSPMLLITCNNNSHQSSGPSTLYWWRENIISGTIQDAIPMSPIILHRDHNSLYRRHWYQAVQTTR